MRAIATLMLLLPGAALAQDLTLSGECPGPLDIQVSGVTPGGSYALLTADGSGSAALPGGPCAGTVLGLGTTGLTLRTTRTADLNGQDLATPNLPLAGCDMAMQIVDMTTCTTSNYDFIPRPVVVTTIADVQAGTHSIFDVVLVHGVVTAAADDGLWIQEAGSSAAGTGVYVYLGADWDLTWGAVAQGDLVDVQGEYREYFDLTEVNVVDSPSGLVAVTGVDVIPAPALVTIADLASNAEPWEGLLVQIANPTVQGLPNGFGEWVVTDGSDILVIDDDMYLPGALAIGQTFTSITGVLHYAFGAYRLLPRDAGDLL